jgi:Bacterial Ig-like domain (group 3)
MCTTSFTSAQATHTITAVYNGVFDNSPASSADNLDAIVQIITPDKSSVAVTSSPGSSVYGTPVIFTATVTPVAPATSTPTGTVSFQESPPGSDPAPQVWFAPTMNSPGELNLFQDPQEWPKALASVNVLELIENQLNPTFVRDNNLVGDLASLNAARQMMGLPSMALSIEAGVIKPSDLSNPWLAVLATEDPIQTVVNNGGSVQYVAMDSPLTDGVNPDITSPPLTDSDIDDRVASYIKDVQSYQPTVAVGTTEPPAVQVGDIEPYPYLSTDQSDGTDVVEIETYVDGLIKDGATPAFFHLDINYADLPPTATFQKDLIALRKYFAGDNAGNENIPFGILFDEPGPVASDQDYSTKTLQNIDKVKSAMGVPQQAVFDSNDARDQFGNQYLPTNVPETQPYTSTWLVNQGIQYLLLAGGVTLSGGVATFSTSALAGGPGGTAGTHTITALYSPDTDANFVEGDENTPQVEVITKATSSVSVSSSVSPTTSVTFGLPVTLTASVSAASPGPPGYPTGTVTFTDGSTPLASVPLTSGQATFTSQTTFPSLAIFTTSSLSFGTHTITATYSGDNNFGGATSPDSHPAVVQIAQADSTITISSSLKRSVSGQTVTITGTVSAVSPSTGTPTGTVTFTEDSTTLPALTLNGSGLVTFTMSSQSASTHTITATYSGDDNFQAPVGNSDAFVQIFTPYSSAVTLAPLSESSVYGEPVDPVTLTATVAPVPAGTETPVTGTVTFMEGSTTLAPAVSVTAGQAILTTSSLSAATHTITATYSGDANFAGATATEPAVVTIDQAGSITTVSSTVTSSGGQTGAGAAVVGQVVTFTATVVSAVPSGAGTPTGTVTFQQEPLKHNSTLAGSVALNSHGQATFTTSTLSTVANAITTITGTYTIKATYSGDGNFSKSTGDDSSAPQVVNKASTTTTVSSTVNPSVFGQVVTFTAKVSAAMPGAIWPNDGVPTGIVTFTEGSTMLAESPIAAPSTSSVSAGILTTTVNYQATFTTNSLSVNTHTITASYSEDGNFNSSTGGPDIQIVNHDGTTAALTASVSTVTYGQTVILTASISANAPGAGTPTGTVTFLDGSTILATKTLNNAEANFSTTSLVGGTHSITCMYGGDIDFNASTSSSSTVTVNKDATSITINLSSTSITFGQELALTASVTPTPRGPMPPSGTVVFNDGTQTLGTWELGGSGRVALATSALPIGTSTITATYSGDANYLVLLYLF